VMLHAMACNDVSHRAAVHRKQQGSQNGPLRNTDIESDDL